MIGIVMTFYNRQPQLINTLNSFRQYNQKEFFVVVVDDGSDKDIEVPEKMPYSLTIIKMRNKTWTNPEPAYNVGINYALKKGADILILQNAECYHITDILTAAKTVTDNTYITFGCYSQGKDEVMGSVINNRIVKYDGDSGWYNHPVHRPVAYDFCAAITATNIRKLNGYDERLSFGWAYGDNYLLARIQMLGLEVFITEDPYVIHQWHQCSKSSDTVDELVMKNYRLYHNLLREQNSRAVHIITEDIK